MCGGIGFTLNEEVADEYALASERYNRSLSFLFVSFLPGAIGHFEVCGICATATTERSFGFTTDLWDALTSSFRRALEGSGMWSEIFGVQISLSGLAG